MRIKKVITAFGLVGALAVTGCTTSLNEPLLVFPEVAAKTPLMSVSSIKVNDLRDNKTLAIINGEAAPANPELTKVLTDWLNASIGTSPRGRLSMEVNLLSYASYVKQDAMHFTTESVMEWQVQINGPRGYNWNKPYQATINQTGAMAMSKREIEAHLNKMAATLLNRTLKDMEFKGALSQQ